jgi:hypothetical protein
MAKRGRKPTGKHKLVVVSMTLSPGTREDMKAEAARSGMKPAAFCRMAVEKLLKVRRLSRKINEHRER